MSGLKRPVPVPTTVLRSVLDLLVQAKGFTPLHHEAVALIGDLTDMLDHAEAPDSEGSIAAELLEAIGFACKVELPTEPTLHALRSAREALASIAVEAKIIDLPRAVSPDVRRDIAAEVSRQLDQAQGVDVSIVDSDYTDRGTHRYPARPLSGEVIELPGGDLRRVASVSVRCGHVAVRLEPTVSPRGEIYTGTG